MRKARAAPVAASRWCAEGCGEETGWGLCSKTFRDTRFNSKDGMRHPAWPHLQAAPSLLGFGDVAPGSYGAGSCKKHAWGQFGFSAGQQKPFLQSDLWQKGVTGVSCGWASSWALGREVCNPIPLFARIRKDGQQARLPTTPPTLFFYLQKPPGGPPGPAQCSSKCPRSQDYVSLPSLPFSLLSCLKASGSPCTHPESSSLCESPHQSPAIDLTSVISAISPATEQILGSYQPIKESKNAVTSFLSAKRTQSPADYSINLLMNLSCQTDSQHFCKVGMGNFNLPGGAGPGLTRL